MRDNIDLFKDSITQLQQKNQDLQHQRLFTSQSQDISQINELFRGLKDDNERLAAEIKSLAKENQDLKSTNDNLKARCTEQGGVIQGL